jgi:hypothetical protein
VCEGPQPPRIDSAGLSGQLRMTCHEFGTEVFCASLDAARLDLSRNAGPGPARPGGSSGSAAALPAGPVQPFYALAERSVGPWTYCVVEGEKICTCADLGEGWSSTI